MTPPLSIVRSRLLRLRREVVVLAYALLARGTPLRIRVAGLAILAYLASPFDLLPEVVPLIGILDDLTLVPWAIELIVRRIPEPQRAAAETRAERFIGRYLKRPLTFLVVVGLSLLVLWSTAIWLFWLWIR